ncbi:tellurium resistance protein TerA [Brevibacillus laterosporus]|uniref:Tellurium resistance protein TerA n=1 Tax=Brevibacillus laterosporus TaxID=1465 RepID=A0A518V6M7_BRELA|nr:TerD family protein [Brevibacillus laterosporus]QDX92681.1 tellurium resistance protein TerA [Brevibacillus laterosporus]TPG70993.1 tellurium resistance protein TerA [Brevibacillus laterosporus]
MVTLIKGQKTDVTKPYPHLTKISVGLGWEEARGVEIDASAFLLATNGLVHTEEDFIFYSNPVNRNNSFQMQEGKGDRQQFLVDLQQIPSVVEKIAFTLTIYEAQLRQQNFIQVKNTYIRILDQATSQEIIRFQVDPFTVETAIVVGELYRYNGQWKFNAIGAGFSGGLAALCGNFGVEVEESLPVIPPAPVPVPSTTSPTFVPPAPTIVPTTSTSAPVPVPTPTIQLSKIELTKKDDVVSLKKTKKTLGEVVVNLNWNKKQSSTGFFGMGKKAGVDLDLGCLFEHKDGSKVCIQALGNQFGFYEDYPYILLDGDDRSGNVTTGENIRINGSYVKEFRRILLYAYIYDGVASWADADGIVTIKQEDNPEIVVKLDVHDPRKIMCAIAMIETEGDTLRIRRLVEYFAGHKQMDKHYNFGLKWVPGSK